MIRLLILLAFLLLLATQAKADQNISIEKNNFMQTIYTTTLESCKAGLLFVKKDKDKVAIAKCQRLAELQELNYRRQIQ